MDRGIEVIVYPEGKTYASGELPPTRTIKMISPGLFGTLETRVIVGRDVTWAELYDERNVVLVSESFARVEWNSVAGDREAYQAGYHSLLARGDRSGRGHTR